MSEPELPPLPADIAQLVRDAGAPTPPADFHEAVLQRLNTSLSGAAAIPVAASALGKFGLLTSVGALVLGLAGGLVLSPLLRPAELHQPVPVAPVVPALAAPDVPHGIPTPVVDARPPSVEDKPVLRRPTPPVAPPTRDVNLAQERALLEMARTALGRGEAGRALESLQDHARRFASGQLVEERESLAIEALASSGQLDEATRRAAAFRARFPQSMLLPAVEAALEPR